VENGDTVTEDDIFMFRMRVGGESGRYVWQAHLETDGNANDVEYILQLVQSGNPSDQGVELVKTSVGGPTLDDTEVEKKATAERLGDPSLYSRWTPVAGSATDYFVDIAIPWQILANKTGVAKLEDIRAVLATSSTHSGINKDAPIGADLSLQISNALSDSIPEPAVVTLLLGAGGGLIFFQRIFKRKDAEDVES
jgi:hypothetical protein